MTDQACRLRYQAATSKTDGMPLCLHFDNSMGGGRLLSGLSKQLQGSSLQSRSAQGMSTSRQIVFTGQDHGCSRQPGRAYLLREQIASVSSSTIRSKWLCRLLRPCKMISRKSTSVFSRSPSMTAGFRSTTIFLKLPRHPSPYAKANTSCRSQSQMISLQ